MAVATRPSTVTAGPHTKDDGLFGPDSITWRLHAEPSMLIVGSAAATTQMLHPRVMRMIDQASAFRQFPQRRAERTGEYVLTITYGDTETAEQAAAALMRVHEHVTALDPETGETYHAKVEELLLWVHCTIVDAVLAAADTYGPALTTAERDRYVDEQRISARLVGCDLDAVPADAAGIDAYVQAMLPHLAFTHEAVWFRDMVMPRGLPLGRERTPKNILARAAVGLMRPQHRELYDVVWPRWVDGLVRTAAGGMFKAASSSMPFDALLPTLRARVDVSAFGAHRATAARPTS